VGETGAALERIEAKVSEINAVVATMSSSAEEQATSLQQVAAAVNHMDQATQQNAAMSQQASAASQSLASESEQLARLVGRFKVPPAAENRCPARRRAPRLRPLNPHSPDAPVSVRRLKGAATAARRRAPSGLNSKPRGAP